MKIQKGHYVPKELITSEAVHEAVVKCFVAAGFKDERPDFWVHKDYHHFHLGLAIDNDGTILWGQKEASAQKPLTLQQLFTAENGLQWPDESYRISANGTAVWFDLKNQPPVVISGSFSGRTESVILATRQPKEKEVNEALDKAVIDLDGKLPERTFNEATPNNYYISTNCICLNGCVIGHITEYVDRAKELGFINGYRWGVEYPTNGKRPELPHDVLITIKRSDTGEKFSIKRKVKHNDWDITESFCIEGPRYKPKDTSYLQTPAVEPAEAVAQSEWWDYENDRIIDGCYPPIGTKCKYKASAFKYETCEIVAVNYPEVAFICKRNEGRIFVDEVNSAEFRPLDHATRKSELEKKRVVDAAYQLHYKCADYEDFVDKLYTDGYLRLPEQPK
jgi:hypothetical protein